MKTVRKDPPLLRYLGFRADNLCNLSCRMCHPGVSTGWYGDARALGQSVPEGLVAALADDSSREQFFEFILRDLEVLYLAGGEPLLSENTLRLISRLRAANRRNLQIIVNTNLSVTRARAERVISELSFFGDVSLNLSFDAFGSRAEYLRKGQVWEEVEESVRYCRAAFPQIALKVTPTVSILNFLHLPDFVRHLITHLGFDPADFRFSILNSPYHYRPELLPKRLIEVGTTELRLLQKRLIVEFDQARIGMFVTQTNALIRHLSECNSSDDLHEFIAATKELDGLRNERVQEVFPELRELFTENEPLEFAES